MPYYVARGKTIEDVLHNANINDLLQNQDCRPVTEIVENPFVKGEFFQVFQCLKPSMGEGPPLWDYDGDEWS